MTRWRSQSEMDEERMESRAKECAADAQWLRASGNDLRTLSDDYVTQGGKGKLIARELCDRADRLDRIGESIEQLAADYERFEWYFTFGVRMPTVLNYSNDFRAQIDRLRKSVMSEQPTAPSSTG